MKMKSLTLLFILSLGLLISCNNNGKNVSQQYEAINGTWNLKNVYGGFLPTDIDYNLGDVIWTFNTTNATLIVKNNITTNGPEYINAGIESGTYSYEIKLYDETLTLFIDDMEDGYLKLSNNSLIITEIADDGFVTEFER